MSCCCATLPVWENLPTGFTGTTYGGTNFVIDGEGVYDELAGVNITFTLSGETEPALTLDQTDGVEITSSAIGHWEFQLLAIIDLTLAKGVYTYLVECIGDSGIQTNYFTGTFQVK